MCVIISCIAMDKKTVGMGDRALFFHNSSIFLFSEHTQQKIENPQTLTTENIIEMR